MKIPCIVRYDCMCESKVNAVKKFLKTYNFVSFGNAPYMYVFCRKKNELYLNNLIAYISKEFDNAMRVKIT